MHQLHLLSPDQHLEPVEIAAGIAAPMLWAKKIVLLSHPDPNKELRRIPFTRGLNVVRTERRKPGERRCVAHDVGKTLLVRLLRYTLGDPWFGDRVTMDRVREAYPFGLAVAQWHLADGQWTIVRALDEQWQPGYVVRGFDWASSLDAPDARLPMDVFFEAIDAQMKAELPKFSLPNTKEAGFADILPWLARDTQFGFHKADSWRDKDVNSGPPNSPSTNRLLMKWLAGMMSPAEVNSRNLKQTSRTESKVNTATHEKNATRLATLYDSLKDATGFVPPLRSDDDEAIATEELAGELIAFIKDEFGSIQSFNADAERADTELLTKAESKFKRLRDEQSEAMRHEEQAKAKLQQSTNNLASEVKEDKPPPGCPAGAQCQWRLEIEKDSSAGGAIKEESHLDRLRSEQADAKAHRDECSSNLASVNEEYEATERELGELRERVQTNRSNRQSSFAKWDQLAAMTSSLAAAIQAFDTSKHQADMSESDVDFHQNVIRQEEKSEASRSSLTRAEQHYSHALSRVMGHVVRGKLETAGGFRPSRSQETTRHGTALTTIENILAFDLGCVLASMCGIGLHPRLLIHDGPREGEAESELFTNLLSTAEWMQGLCEPADVSFQYIVTTADAPEAYSQNHPAVADVLHGRSPDGLLLRKAF